MIAMHKIVFPLQAGYNYTKKNQHPKAYWHPIDNLPNRMEGPIEPLVTINVQQGPPDWVSGPGGMTYTVYTCKDVTISVRTRLPTLQGCLNSDMGDG